MKTERILLIGFLGLFATLILFELPSSPLFDPDEARYAEIPREMLASHDFVTPRLNGSSYFEKPPLLYWLNAASLSVLGETPFAARLPSKLATIGTALLLAFAFGSRFLDTGLWAGLIYLSAIFPFAVGRINLTDNLLCFNLTLAFLSMKRLLNAWDEGQDVCIHQIGLGVGMALATLTKGLIGIVLPALVFFIWIAIFNRWRYLVRLMLSWTPAVFFVLTTPWFILVEKSNPGFSKFFFIHEHFLRYTTAVSERPGPFHYFIPVFICGLLPWTVYFVDVIRLKRDLFFTLWCVVVIAFFSFSKSKLIPYIAPTFPAAAALLAAALISQSNFPRRHYFWNAVLLSIIGTLGFAVGLKSGFLQRYQLVWHGALIAILMILGSWSAYILALKYGRKCLFSLCASWAGVTTVLITATPLFAKDYSLHNLAQKAAATNASTIVNYHTFGHSFPWVLKRPVPVVRFKGELASDNKLSPDLFWDEDRFWTLWNSPEKITVLLRKEERKTFEQYRNTSLISENKHFLLLSNFVPPNAN